MTPLEKRNVELEETLGIIVPLANHVIINLLAIVNEDELEQPEWGERLSRWRNAWMHAHEVLTPGLLPKSAGK